jgi:hypothetical protein
LRPRASRSSPIQSRRGTVNVLLVLMTSSLA